MVFIGRLRLFGDTGADYLTFDTVAASSCGSRPWHRRRRTICKSSLFAIVNGGGVAPVLGHLRTTFTLVRCRLLLLVKFIAFLILSDLQRLIQFVLDDLAGRGFHILKRDCWLFRGTLRLKSLTLRLWVVNGTSREGLPHVLIPLILLVYQMVRRCDMIVTVGLKASD